VPKRIARCWSSAAGRHEVPLGIAGKIAADITRL